MSRAHIEHGIASGWMSEHAAEQIDVPQRRLSAVLEEAAIAPGFDLLVVDVEGAEIDVFAGFDLARWHPAAIIVELADFDPSPGGAALASPAAADARRVREALLAAGYEAVYADFNNTLFRRGAP
jgi:hypothetical protein